MKTVESKRREKEKKIMAKEGDKQGPAGRRGVGEMKMSLRAE